MAMSRASLYNKVKQITGLGVNEYINRLRIERSVYLLANTNLSISEISYEVGFSYPRYFSTSFKQMKGVTPSQFKEKNKIADTYKLLEQTRPAIYYFERNKELTFRFFTSSNRS